MVGFVLRADAPIVGCGEMVESKEELKGKARRYLYLRADPQSEQLLKWPWQPPAKSGNQLVMTRFHVQT
jgi:hypothetical protein